MNEIRFCKAIILFYMSVFCNDFPVFPVTDEIIDCFDFAKLFEGFSFTNAKNESELQMAVLNNCFDTKND